VNVPVLTISVPVVMVVPVVGDGGVLIIVLRLHPVKTRRERMESSHSVFFMVVVIRE
jgi:hypothetical protein